MRDVPTDYYAVYHTDSVTKKEKNTYLFQVSFSHLIDSGLDNIIN